MALAGLLIANEGAPAQAPAADAPAYVNENTADPAPLKLREVEGKVAGLGGDAMPRASVALFGEAAHGLVAATLTDKDGKFRFDKVEKGAYRLVVQVAGLCPANVPVVVGSSLLERRRMVVTMRPKDIDTCSYALAK